MPNRGRHPGSAVFVQSSKPHSHLLLLKARSTMSISEYKYDYANGWTAVEERCGRRRNLKSCAARLAEMQFNSTSDGSLKTPHPVWHGASAQGCESSSSSSRPSLKAKASQRRPWCCIGYSSLMSPSLLRSHLEARVGERRVGVFDEGRI